MPHPDFFHRSVLRPDVQERILNQIHASGLDKGQYSAYLVGDLVGDRSRLYSPFQVVVTLNNGMSADDFNDQIGKYMQNVTFPELERKCEFVFQNGLINLDDHNAVYDVTNKVWFKKPEKKTAQEFPDHPKPEITFYNEPDKQEMKQFRYKLSAFPGLTGKEISDTLKEWYPHGIHFDYPNRNTIGIWVYPKHQDELFKIMDHLTDYVGTSMTQGKPAPQSVLSSDDTDSFFIQLPAGITKGNLEMFFNENGAKVFQIDAYGKNTFEITSYVQYIDKLKQLAHFFKEDHNKDVQSRPKKNLRIVPWGEGLSVRAKKIAMATEDIEAKPEWVQAKNQLQTLGGYPGVENWTLVKNSKPTGELTPERQQLHEQIINATLNPNAAVGEQQRPRAVLMLGPPGGGKSTIVSQLKARFGETTNLDPDILRSRLPEYQGWNAAATQGEATYINRNALQRAIGARHNLILDQTGTSYPKMEKIVNNLAAKGYDVHIVHVGAPLDVRLDRIWERFLRNHRYVDLKYLIGHVDSKPEFTYEYLKQNPNVTSWMNVDNSQHMKPQIMEEGNRWT